MPPRQKALCQFCDNSPLPACPLEPSCLDEGDRVFRLLSHHVRRPKLHPLRDTAAMTWLEVNVLLCRLELTVPEGLLERLRITIGHHLVAGVVSL